MQPSHHPYAHRAGWKGGVAIFLASREGGSKFFCIAGQNCPTPLPVINDRSLTITDPKIHRIYQDKFKTCSMTLAVVTFLRPPNNVEYDVFLLQLPGESASQS